MLDKLDKMWYNIEVRLKVIKNIILNCCLGQKVKTYRIMKEMSQQDLEDKTGVCSLKLFDNSINL